MLFLDLKIVLNFHSFKKKIPVIFW